MSQQVNTVKIKVMIYSLPITFLYDVMTSHVHHLHSMG